MSFLSLSFFQMSCMALLLGKMAGACVVNKYVFCEYFMHDGSADLNFLIVSLLTS